MNWLQSTMTFLPIVERELRVAARKATTYWMRFFLALAVVAIWFFLLLAEASSRVPKGKILFIAIGILALGFCLLAGLFLTADCLSEEKREGTLGLLFLTELCGFDVVLGKLLATSMHAFYGLLAILPLLALPLLLGGVTVGEFWRVTVVLLATLAWSLSVGMVVSGFSRETRQAMAGTLLLLIVSAGVLPLFWWVQRLLFKGAPWDVLLWPGPVYLYSRSFDVFFASRTGAREFWGALLTVLGISGGALAVASLYLPHAWREKKENRTSERVERRRRWRFGTPEFCLRRRRWLEQNPFYWLASRDHCPRLLAWWILGPLFCIWIGFLSGWFSGSNNTQEICFTVTMTIAFGLHQILKCLMAVEASRRLSDDRHSGALELMIVTPLPAENILAGQRKALKETFRGPTALVLLTNAGQFWFMAFVNPLHMDDRVQAIFAEICLGGAALLLTDIYALSWMGMWMALKTTRHNRAIFGALARVMLVPWLGIFFFILMGIGGVGISSEAMMLLIGLWFLAGLVIDMAIGIRAEIKLLEELRQTPGRDSSRTSRASFIRPPAIGGPTRLKSLCESERPIDNSGG